MPRPRKPSRKKDPYVLFCLEQEQMDPDLKGKSLQDLTPLCSDKWQDMKQEQRQRYHDMANEYNEDMLGAVNRLPKDGNLAGRFDSYGRSLLALHHKEEIKKYDRQVMMEDIKLRIERGLCSGDLINLRFHVMFVQPWTNPGDRNIDVDSQDEVLFPAEIGLVEFSLGKGVKGVFHQLVGIKDIPLGYKGDMKAHSDKYHKIWLDNKKLCYDYDAILNSIMELISPNAPEMYAGERSKVTVPSSIEEMVANRESKRQTQKRFMPVFASAELLETCRRSMHWLQKQTKIEDEIVFYELEVLFQLLLEKSPNEKKFEIPPISITEANLGRDAYLYTPGVLCPFHYEVECSHCAAAGALRHVIILLDLCVQVYDITPIEGRHYPWGVKIKEIEEQKEKEQSQHCDDWVLPVRQEGWQEIDVHWDLGTTGHPLDFFLKKDNQGDLIMKQFWELNITPSPLPPLLSTSLMSSRGSIRRGLDECSSAFETSTEFHTPAGSEIGDGEHLL